MRSWVDIEKGRGEKSAYSVMMSISHVLWDCLVYSTLRNYCRSFLGTVLRAWIKHLLF